MPVGESNDGVFDGLFDQDIHIKQQRVGVLVLLFYIKKGLTWSGDSGTVSSVPVFLR